MKLPKQNELKPRKAPVQTRSTVTVEAISEATIQVLLELGPDRLTTTHVAKRAGVSIGTLYQYFPNKQSLLFTVMENHINLVIDAVEQTCASHHHQPLATMVESLIQAFVDAKMVRPDISMALYAVAADVGGMALVRKMAKRAQAALSSMLATAVDVRFCQVEFTSMMVHATMAGVTRAVLEAGATSKMVQDLRKHLILLCHSYLKSATTIVG